MDVLLVIGILSIVAIVTLLITGKDSWDDFCEVCGFTSEFCFCDRKEENPYVFDSWD